MIDDYFEKPYWVVDILPKQVPKNCPGQYFAVEDYYRTPVRLEEIRRKFADILIKLSCYYDIRVDCGENMEREQETDPGTLSELLTGAGPAGHFNVLIPAEECLITISGDDTYMTVYDPTEGLLDLIRLLAGAAGLFVWQPGR